MKTIVTLLKIAMLVTSISFVMSCDKNNKRSSNTATVYGASIYTYTNGQCINNQTGQVVATTYCQTQYNNGNGYGTQQCNGNSSLFIFVRGNQYACQTDYAQMQNYYSYGGCWISCANQFGISCSGQVAYPGGTTGSQQQGYQCL